MDNKPNALARYFRFGEHGTNLKTEMLAGITTFLTMAYVLLVNPFLLGEEAGMDFVSSLPSPPRWLRRLGHY